MKTTFTNTVTQPKPNASPALGIPGVCKIPAPCWIRLCVDGFPPYFARVAKEAGWYTRAIIPPWHFPNVKVGDVLEATVEEAEPYRAHGRRAGCFDWNDYIGVTQHTFATEEPSGVLRIWSQYSAPFDLLRCPPVEPLYRMLGFYQAEGSKSATGADFSFANSNVELIRHEIENLNAIGIANTQLYGEILQGVGESRESAVATYESLPLEIHAVRPRPGKGKSAYVLHARNSKPFRGMVIAALVDVFAREFPSREVAKAYALEWLNGDATITHSYGNARLRLAGHSDEQRVVLRALQTAFGWRDRNTHFGTIDNHTERTLNGAEAIDLALSDAFPFSMSRARLLTRISETDTSKVALVYRERFLTGLSLLKDEIELLRGLYLPPVNPKGATYPLRKENGRWVIPSGHL